MKPTPRSRPGQKVRDSAVLLPVVGLLLLVTPLLSLFTGGRLLSGVPLAFLYIFGVWAGLIAGGALLARHLERSRQDAD